MSCHSNCLHQKSHHFQNNHVCHSERRIKCNIISKSGSVQHCIICKIYMRLGCPVIQIDCVKCCIILRSGRIKRRDTFRIYNIFKSGHVNRCDISRIYKSIICHIFQCDCVKCSTIFKSDHLTCCFIFKIYTSVQCQAMKSGRARCGYMLRSG